MESTWCRKGLSLALGAATLAACAGGADGLARVQDQVESARAELVTADAARRAGIDAILGALPPLNQAPTGDPCPVVGEFTGGSLDFDGPSVTIESSHGLAEAAGPRLAAFEGFRTPFMAELLLEEAPTRRVIAELEARAEAGVAPWQRDATIVLSGRTTPRAVSGGGYHAGLLEGALVVWDYEAGRVVCAGRFAATNSPDVLVRIQSDEALRIAYEQDPVSVLEADLTERARAAALERLRATQ